MIHCFSIRLAAMVSWLCAAVVMIGLVAAGSHRATAATVVLAPSKDNTIYGSGDANLSNGLGDSLFAGKNGKGRIVRSLVTFSLAGQIPAGATINSVTLTLGINTPHNNTQTVELHRLLADWGEGTSSAPSGKGGGAAATTGDATWNARFFNTANWTTPGGDFSTIVSAAQIATGSSGNVVFSGAGLVADVQAWVATPAANFGWILLAQNEAAAAVRFASRESAPAPSLLVDYTAPVVQTVVGWGRNTDGGLDIPSAAAGAIDVVAAAYHSLALMSDGTVVRWGNQQHFSDPLVAAARRRERHHQIEFAGEPCACP